MVVSLVPVFVRLTSRKPSRSIAELDALYSSTKSLSVLPLPPLICRRLMSSSPGEMAKAEKLLRRYERARKADVAAMALVTDGLHGVFAHTDGKLQVLRNWGMNRLSGSGPLKNWLAKRAAGTTNL